jgi:hypothetical protein
MKRIAFASLLSVPSFSMAHASPTTSTWTGGVGPFWGSYANWDSFTVPDSDDPAVISGAGSDHPTIFGGNLFEAGGVHPSLGTLTILAGGTLYVDDFVISGGTLTGSGTLVY